MPYTVEPIFEGVNVWSSYEDVGNHHKGWIAGQYVEGMAKLPFEVKLADYEPGLERPWAEPEEGTTVTWITRGSMTLYFREPSGAVKEVALTAGNMINHDNVVPHRWKVGPDGVTAVAVRTKRDFDLSVK